MSEFRKEVDEVTGMFVRTAGINYFTSDVSQSSAFRLVLVLQLTQPGTKLNFAVGRRSKIAQLLKKNPRLHTRMNQLINIVDDERICANCTTGYRFQIKENGTISGHTGVWPDDCDTYKPNLLKVSK